jgi:CBS domain-containing protein
MLRSMRVREYMTKDVVTLDPDMEILRAIHTLVKAEHAAAPVLDQHGRLVGLLTERDCISVATQAYYHGTPGGLVKDRMTHDPVFVGPEDSILDLAGKFIEGRFHRYPVVDNGRLVGIISRRDVMQAMGKHYPQ